MTEYVITEVGRHQWLVFADRQSIAFCASENEAVEMMTEHSGSNSQSRAAIWFGCDAARSRRKMTASRGIPAISAVAIDSWERLHRQTVLIPPASSASSRAAAIAIK
jgi:hypothetical protein